MALTLIHRAVALIYQATEPPDRFFGIVEEVGIESERPFKGLAELSEITVRRKRKGRKRGLTRTD